MEQLVLPGLFEPSEAAFNGFLSRHGAWEHRHLLTRLLQARSDFAKAPQGIEVAVRYALSWLNDPMISVRVEVGAEWDHGLGDYALDLALERAYPKVFDTVVAVMRDPFFHEGIRQNLVRRMERYPPRFREVAARIVSSFAAFTVAVRSYRRERDETSRGLHAFFDLFFSGTPVLAYQPEKRAATVFIAR